MDSAWFEKTVKYVIDKVGKEKFRRSAERFAPSLTNGERAFIEGAEIALMNYLTVGTDDDHPSIGSIWKSEGWTGLNNDERYMSEYRYRSLPGIVEIQKILDEKAMECIDILDKERGRFIVFDRNTAKRAARFDKIVVWITHYPHFTRLAGSGCHLPDNLVEPFLSEILVRATKMRNIQSDEAVKRYLAEHFTEAFELIADLGDKLKDQMIASMDVDQCRAYYKLLAPREEIEAILEEKPDFETPENYRHEPDDPPNASWYRWLRRGEAKVIEKKIRGLIQHGDEDEDGVGILGSILGHSPLFPGKIL